MLIKLLFLLPVLCLGACSPNQRDTAQEPPLPKMKLDPDDPESWKTSADILRSLFPELTRFLKIPELLAVTSEFGPVIIRERNFPANSPLATSRIKPWSSWWYPKKEDFLFTTENGRYASALTKYDLLRKRRFERNREENRPGSAAEFERKNFNPQSLSWEGLCDAWALASITHPEPRRPVTLTENGVSITFSISDLKALLLKTYEAVDDTQLKHYGQKFSGDEQGWIFPDLFPDQFHRLLEVQLFESQLPLIMDHDPGVEVWNVPIYKANFTLDKIPDQPDSVLVRTWVYSAESSAPNEREFVGTKEALREYNYVLVGTRNSQGDLVIHSGYWIKGPQGLNSRKSHPDYMIRIPLNTQIRRQSTNPEIDISLVDEILAQSY